MFDDCIHLSAVRIAIGLHVGTKRPQTNLSALRRRRRFGKKQGQKRRLDSTEQCAPDSKKAKHNVHDSLCRSESAETKAKVQALVGRGTSLQYCNSCTQQTAPADCGCFVAAYAIATALGGWIYGLSTLHCSYLLSVNVIHIMWFLCWSSATQLVTFTFECKHTFKCMFILSLLISRIYQTICQ